MGAPPLLLESFPRLTASLPHVHLCDLPTPVEHLPGASADLGIDLWIKRDDQSALGYGGNKVRKLEFLLGSARREGVRRVVTMGYSGSNHATATAVHCARLGIPTTSVLIRQSPPDAHILENLLVQQAVGTELIDVPDNRAAKRVLAGRFGVGLTRSPLGRHRHIRFIPTGGSNNTGIAGFVNAGFELAQQVRAGTAPEPTRIYVAFSTMGTGIGLLLGLRAAGLSGPEVHLVQVVGDEVANVNRFEKRLAYAQGFLQDQAPDFPSLDYARAGFRIRREFLGPAYAHPTPWANQAAERIRHSDGVLLESVYTAKAFGAIVADAQTGLLEGPVLFWNSFNSRPLQPLIGNTTIADLPEAFRCFGPFATAP